MKRLLYTGVVAFCFVVASCSNNKTKSNHLEEISIDFDKVKNFDLSGGGKINLEFSDSSIIKRIDELDIYDEAYYVIRSGGDLLIFNKDGSFKNRIGGMGNGPAEFTHFNSFFIKKDTVYIYDAMAKKIVLYDLNGKFLDNVSLKDTYKNMIPNYFLPVAKNKFISKNTYGGENKKIPSYSILDENFKIISNINNRYLKNGITSLNNFSFSDNSVLFWELLNDTIFSVTSDTSYNAKYFVNFHDRSLPISILKDLDLYDAIAFTNKPENKHRYASLIRCVSEDEDYLRFIFVYNEDVYYVKSDKNKGTVQTYKLSYGDKKVEPIIFFKDNILVIPVVSYEDETNPTLVILNESLL